MKSISLANERAGNSYPGRGIVIGKSAEELFAEFNMGAVQ